MSDCTCCVDWCCEEYDMVQPHTSTVGCTLRQTSTGVGVFIVNIGI